MSAFKPGEVVWSEQDQAYYMAPAACVVFMLFEAYAPDASISAEQHAHNRASVKRGVRLAVEAGFLSSAQLMAMVISQKRNGAALRALVDEMLQHVTAEQFLQCVIGREEGGAQ